VTEKNTETRRNRQTDIKREKMRKVYREKTCECWGKDKDIKKKTGAHRENEKNL
jgi:hypothetical protein